MAAGAAAGAGFEGGSNIWTFSKLVFRLTVVEEAQEEEAEEEEEEDEEEEEEDEEEEAEE